MNKYKKLASDTVVFAIGNFGSKILSFVFVSLYTAYLTTSEYGDADIITTTIALLLPALSLGISEAVLRFLAEKKESIEDIFCIGLSFILISNCFAIIVFFILSLFWPLFNEYLVLIITLFFVISIEELFSYYVKGIDKTKIFAAKGIIFTIFFIASNVVLLTIFKMGLMGYILSHIVAYTMSAFFIFVSGKIYKIRYSTHLKKILLKNMLIYSIAFVPSTIAWWINSSADKYMLVWIVGSSSNGLYSVAQKIPSLITSITSIITQAWQLSAMRNYGEEGYDDFFSEINELLFILLIFGYAIVLFFNKIMALLLFKNDFYEAWKFVPMLTVAAVFTTISGFLASAFTSAKKTKMLFISTSIAAIVNIIMNYFLIITIGEFGVAISTAFSFFAVVLIRLITMKKLVKLKLNYIKYFISLALLFLSSILVFYLNYYYLISVILLISLLLINFKELKICFKKIMSRFFVKSIR